MTIDSSTPTVEVSHAGPVPEASIERLVDKVRAVTGHCREAVLHIECRLTLIENPAADRPAVAEATLSVNGHPVRAHVAASTPDEAVDLLHDRLARRLERYEDRLHRISERHKADPVNRAHDPEIQEIPPEDREVRRRKTFPLVSTTVEDAVLDLEQLGHDFYVFQEFETGQTCMIDRDDGEFVLHVEDPAALPDHPLPDGVRLHPSPPLVLELDGAREYIANSGQPVLFHRPSAGARPRAIYRRFDGHYGIITAGD